MEGAVAPSQKSLLDQIQEAFSLSLSLRGPSHPVSRSLRRALQCESRCLRAVPYQEKLDRLTYEVAELEKQPPAIPRNPRLVDLTGKLVGVWRVKKLGRVGGVTPQWVCFCEGCGFERLIKGSQLRNQPPACDSCGRRSAK